MRTLIVVLVSWIVLAAPAGVRADVVEGLLGTPATQMDLGVARMGALLAPVFAELGVLGTVVWVGEDSRIDVRIVADRTTEGTATWEPARRAAAAVRVHLGVDPEWGKLLPEESGRLTELFQLAASPAPPAAELAGLVRIRVAVHGGSPVPPTCYSADLLQDDVFLTPRTFEWGLR